MSKQILSCLIIISGTYIQSLSGMLVVRKLLTSNPIKFSSLKKHIRNMATEVNIPKVTSGTKLTYLDRYPYLNLLPSDSFLRAKCEQEAESTHESVCTLYHNFIPMTGFAYDPHPKGSEFLWNLDERLAHARYCGKPVKREDLINKPMLFKICAATYLSSTCLLFCQLNYSDPSLLDKIILSVMCITQYGGIPLGFIAYNQLGSNHSILRKLFKNDSREIQKKALIEYYQLSNRLIQEWKKDKESKATDEVQLKSKSSIFQ